MVDGFQLRPALEPRRWSAGRPRARSAAPIAAIADADAARRGPSRSAAAWRAMRLERRPRRLDRPPSRSGSVGRRRRPARLVSASAARRARRRARAAAGPRRAAGPGPAGGAAGSDHSFGHALSSSMSMLGLAPSRASSSSSTTSSPWSSRRCDQPSATCSSAVAVVARSCCRRSRTPGRGSAPRPAALVAVAEHAPIRVVRVGLPPPERCMICVADPLEALHRSARARPPRRSCVRRSGRRGRSASGPSPRTPTMHAAPWSRAVDVAADAGRVLAVEDVLGGHRAEASRSACRSPRSARREALLVLASPGGGRASRPALADRQPRGQDVLHVQVRRRRRARPRGSRRRASPRRTYSTPDAVPVSTVVIASTMSAQLEHLAPVGVRVGQRHRAHLLDHRRRVAVGDARQLVAAALACRASGSWSTLAM